MSPRNKQLNKQIREKRKSQILDAALTAYVKFGYNGTDMDFVAAQAGLAKGLVYYYYKTKKELFRELFQWAIDKTMQDSQQFFESHREQTPVKRLVHYIKDIFVLANKDPRVIQFAMRFPFDAYAVFGSDQWRDGLEKSSLHQKSIASIIQDGINAGEIPPVEPNHAANCFWAVFVANLFSFPRLIGCSVQSKESPVQLSQIRQIALFCFQGLGIKSSAWSRYLEEITCERNHANENI